MHTYYFEGELEGVITLDEVESNHAIKVMRSKIDSSVRIINGLGFEGVGKIVSAHSKRCEVVIDSVLFSKREFPVITIAIAPTKSNDRIEFFIEKATEIGVSKIVPLLCKNNERDKVKVERWKKVALAATKQSRRKWMPEITDPIKFDQYLLDGKLPKTKLIAYCEDLPEKSILDFKGNLDVLVLIGPEGDFTHAEVEEAAKKGFERVNLGNNRLRTETAGIVAVTQLI